MFVDAFMGSGSLGAQARAALRAEPVLIVPAIFDVEVTSALRGLVLRGAVTVGRAGAARERLRRTKKVRYPFPPFSDRIWELRDNVTAYDAWYLALAERLGTTLLTTDTRLVAVPGVRCPVIVPSG